MDLKSSYRLSCIVPIYNVEDYLEECVESLLKVSSVSLEIILINDGSTDLSGDIADYFATHQSFIKVIHQSNQGLAAARNRGLEEASGNYVAFIDSDDWVAPEQLSELCRKAEEAKADMVLGTVLYVNPDSRTYSPFLPLPEFVTRRELSGTDCFAELFRTGKFVPMATSYLYRREWLEKNHLHFEPVLHEDKLWSVKALCLANRAICTELPFYYYRQRAGSIMNTLDAGKRLNSLLYIANRLTAEARALCLPFYRIAHKKLKNYHSWLISTEVTEVPEVIPDETIVILFHNRMWEIPLRYPKEQIQIMNGKSWSICISSTKAERLSLWRIG